MIVRRTAVEECCLRAAGRLRNDLLRVERDVKPQLDRCTPRTVTATMMMMMMMMLRMRMQMIRIAFYITIAVVERLLFAWLSQSITTHGR